MLVLVCSWDLLTVKTATYRFCFEKYFKTLCPESKHKPRGFLSPHNEAVTAPGDRLYLPRHSLPVGR